jgi:type VI secretion system protein VasG
MSQIDFARIIPKLDTPTRQALENATKDALERHHAEVHPEHWLLQLLLHAPELKDYPGISQQLITTWQGQLELYLKNLPAKHQGVPKLSPWLAQLLQYAVMEASAEFNQTKLQAILIFYCFFKTLREQLWPVQNYHQLLLNIDLTAFKQHIVAELNKKNASLGHESDVLKRYTTNLTELARNHKIDAVVGREQELRQMLHVLIRRRQNNPILVGEAGVGKTALAEALALHIVAGDVPPMLRNTELLSLDLAALQAGAGVQGEFEQRFKDLIKAVQEAKTPIILFIDEAHNLIGAGGKTGQGDVANLLKPLLARGELRTIAATTWSEYKKYIEHDSALTRRFEMIRVLEPDDTQAIAMLLGLIPKLEAHHQVLIAPEAIDACVKLSRRYLPNRQLPDKAVSLLDTACARVKLSQNTTPVKLAHAEQKLAQFKIELGYLERSFILGEATEASVKALQRKITEEDTLVAQLIKAWQQEQNLMSTLQTRRNELINGNSKDKKTEAAYQKILKELKALQGEDGLLSLQVDVATIAEVVSNSAHVPVGKLMRSELSTTLAMADELKKQVLGQEYALELISRKLQTARVNLQDPHKPQGIFLLVGNSGIGKTETAYAIAEQLYGGRTQLSVINMSEFKEAHKVSMLTGAPAGYVGYGEGGVLTEAIRRRPYGVVLLDEMEKAHLSIQDIFFQVFDKGSLTDGQGREIDCRHTVFLLTSNLGSLSLAKANPDTDTWQDHLEQELLSYFKPAFLGRLIVLPYFNLNADILIKIAQLKLTKISERLMQQHQICLKYAPKLLKQLALSAENSMSNAREIDKILETEVLPKLSQHILKSLLKEVKQPKALTLSYQPEQGYFFKI